VLRRLHVCCTPSSGSKSDVQYPRAKALPVTISSHPPRKPTQVPSRGEFCSNEPIRFPPGRRSSFRLTYQCDWARAGLHEHDAKPRTPKWELTAPAAGIIRLRFVSMERPRSNKASSTVIVRCKYTPQQQCFVRWEQLCFTVGKLLRQCLARCNTSGQPCKSAKSTKHKECRTHLSVKSSCNAAKFVSSFVENYPCCQLNNFFLQSHCIDGLGLITISTET